MILILSREIEEPLTCRVIDFLNRYKSNYVRLNGEDLFNGKAVFNYYLNQNKHEWELEILIDEKIINSAEIKSIWFRRDFFELTALNNHPIVNDFLKAELNILYSNFENIFKNAKWINKPSDRRVNKLYMLEKASKNGLMVPHSYIINHRSILDRIKNDIITKPISESFSIVENGMRQTAFTAQVDILNQQLKDYKDFFFPSFLQENIKKQYEIRCFYLDGQIYSMAIFSQSDSKTSVDFRNYNEEKPNRNSKYKLPYNIEESIRKFMIDININCGSIDLIRGIDNEYYFLELNPVGQLGVVSRFGNYELEKKIALKLIENDK